jgi:hypothetical protein
MGRKRSFWKGSPTDTPSDFATILFRTRLLVQYKIRVFSSLDLQTKIHEFFSFPLLTSRPHK